MPRANYPYSLKSGDSVYPIRANTVFRCHKTVSIYHKKANANLEHTVFLWILLESKDEPKKYGPKRRRVRVLKCFVPVPQEWRQFPKNIDKWVLRDPIGTLYLQHGYDILATDLKYNYEDKDARKFYKLIGLMK